MMAFEPGGGTSSPVPAPGRPALETEETSDREDRREDAKGEEEGGCDGDPPWVGFSLNSFFFVQGFWITSFCARQLGWAIKMASPPRLGSGQSEARDPPNDPVRGPAVIKQGPLTLQYRDRRRPDDQHDPEANAVGDSDPRRNREQLHVGSIAGRGYPPMISMR